MPCRAGEPEKTRFRSDRFYVIEEKYYFSTREGHEIGPFGSKFDAEEGLKRYLKTYAETSNDVLAKDAAMLGEWANTNFQ